MVVISLERTVAWGLLAAVVLGMNAAALLVAAFVLATKIWSAARVGRILEGRSS